MSDLMLVSPFALREDPVEMGLMTPYFPLGLLYLAAVAREKGYDVSIFDAAFSDSDQRFQEALERHRPRWVGLSVLATFRRQAFRLAEIAHRFGAGVMVGGADPTGRPETYLRHECDGVKPIDLVVVGEGEETLECLLPLLLEDNVRKSDLGSIPGVAYLNSDGRVLFGGPRPRLVDLDSLPFPARELIDIEAYRRAWRAKHERFSLSLLTSRGCPFDCAWCQRAVFGRSFRQRSPQSVADEMALMKKEYQPDHLRILDDVFGISLDWLRKWHDEVIARDAAIPFECLCRVDLIDDERVRLLKEAGCRRIAFGAESGSQAVLDAMHKGTRVEEISRAVELCRKYDLEVYFYMMLGYPGEEWEDILRSIKLLQETCPDAYSTSVAYPLPGTPFFEMVKGELSVLHDWSHSAENRLLFRRRYSTRFYRMVQRTMYVTWRLSRWQKGFEALDWLSRLRFRVSAWCRRRALTVLRLLSRPEAVQTMSS